MRIFVDENIPLRSVKTLRAQGHEVIDIRGTPEEGRPDDSVWRRVLQGKALLITTDKGFVRRADEPHFGLLVIRLRKPNRQRIDEKVQRAMAQFTEREWPGMLVVMRDRAQSIRRNRPHPSD